MINPDRFFARHVESCQLKFLNLQIDIKFMPILNNPWECLVIDFPLNLVFKLKSPKCLP